MRPVRTARYRLLLCLSVALGAGMPVSAALAQEAPPPECGPDRKNCLTWARGHLDGDDKPDTAMILYYPRQKIYAVHVQTAVGIDYVPFQAAHDPKDRVTIAYRSGPGDPRCRNFIANKGCGYSIDMGSQGPVLFLSDSRHGDFVLSLLLPHLQPHAKPSDTRFIVLPALDGPPTDVY